MKSERNSTKPEAAAAVDCPAAALARRAERLLQASEIYEDRKAPLDDISLTEIYDALRAIECSIGVCEALSLEGAIFQLVMASNLVASMIEFEHEETLEYGLRAILRMLWSVRNFLASSTGTTPSKAVSDYYMADYCRTGAAIAAADAGTTLPAYTAAAVAHSNAVGAVAKNEMEG